jgi:hypothetical protein
VHFSLSISFFFFTVFIDCGILVLVYNFFFVYFSVSRCEGERKSLKNINIPTTKNGDLFVNRLDILKGDQWRRFFPLTMLKKIEQVVNVFLFGDILFFFSEIRCYLVISNEFLNVSRVFFLYVFR